MLMNDSMTTGHSIAAIRPGLGSGLLCADPGQSCRPGPWEGGGPGPRNSSPVPVLLLANCVCLMGPGAPHKAATQCPPTHTQEAPEPWPSGSCPESDGSGTSSHRPC